MKNDEIASIFSSIADLLEIKGENPFRIRAYRRAAQNIESLGRDLSGLSDEELLDLPGIGRDLSAKIHEYITTGKIGAYEKLKQELPESLLTLLNIPGIGPRTAALLYKEYGVRDIDHLEALAREHKLASLPGIKEKTEASIIKGIQMVRRYSERHPLGSVLPVALNIRDHLSASSPVGRIEIAGSIRRWKETVKDIDMICTSSRPGDVMRSFASMPDVKEVLMRGRTKSSAIISGGIQVDLRVVDDESFGAALSYFTGSKEHNIRLREIAQRAGMKLNEYGIFRESDNKKLGGRNEEDIYNVLGMQYVPPELREDRGEIQASMSNELPELVSPADMRGDLHCHSIWSDGSSGIEEIADAAVRNGYKYLAITDHSKGLGVAGGLSEEQLLEQIAEIRALNKRLKGFRLLAGTEVNILNDGSPDYDDDILRHLDIVVASVHSGFKQSKEQLTNRIIRAMENPYVSVIGHISGRLLGGRDAYDMEMDAVIDAAARTGTAIEINAHPMRLDLTDVHARVAGQRGVGIVISTDSHSPSQLGNMRYGVSVARRAWLEKKDILNTLPAGALLKRLKKRQS